MRRPRLEDEVTPVDESDSLNVALQGASAPEGNEFLRVRRLTR